jgi:hypothetical protein
MQRAPVSRLLSARLLSAAPAMAALACSVVAPDDSQLTGGRCGALEKVCSDTCASTLSPAVGCAAEACAPCELPNAVPMCEGGRCAIATCELGFGDCNADASDGCETNLRADAAHCGACDQACALPTATAACQLGRCVPASCLPGRADCDGSQKTVCETSLADDPKHCGQCGATCALPNVAQAACQKGVCNVASCEPGRADCDGAASNGCEVDVTSSSAHCGACSQACAAEKLCVAAQCAPRCGGMRSLYPQAQLTLPPAGFGVGAGDFTVEMWVSVPAGPENFVELAMNATYSVNSIRLFAALNETGCMILNPKGASPKLGSGHATAPGLAPGHWSHVACVRADGMLSLYVDGKLANAVPVATDLLALSPTALRANHGAIGPLRFSKTKRYAANFTPSAVWPVDADTVAQFLTKLPFLPGAQAALTDEAGGDNNAAHHGGFVPELSDMACGG